MGGRGYLRGCLKYAVTPKARWRICDLLVQKLIRVDEVITNIMISIIIIVMDVKTLTINVSTISLIHTSTINDIQYIIYMVVTLDLPLYRIIKLLL